MSGQNNAKNNISPFTCFLDTTAQQMHHFTSDSHYLTQYECRAVSTARYKSWHWITQVLEILITFHYFHGIFSFVVWRETCGFMYEAQVGFNSRYWLHCQWLYHLFFLNLRVSRTEIENLRCQVGEITFRKLVTLLV